MTPEPITPSERARIVEAIRDGGKRNDLARQFQRSPSTISKIAHAEGLAFDRSKTEAASKAKQADNRERRAQLGPVYLDEAKAALAQLPAILARMAGPTLVYNFGGRDNTYEEHILDNPPDATIANAARAYRDLMQAARAATMTVLDMERLDQPAAGFGVAEQLVDAIRNARITAES